MSEVMRWAPVIDIELLQLALIAVVIPSLGEELLFRVALLPAPHGQSSLPLFQSSVGLALFIAWHPLQAWLFGGERAKIFLDPWFLVAVAAVGMACTRAYWSTGSIWPAVVLHWLAVLGWKAFAGGPPLF